MLSACDLKTYASIRGMSVRDIEAYCDLSAGHISNVFNGTYPLTEDAGRKIANAINAAYAAKLNGTFKRPPLDKNKNAIKETDGTSTSREKPQSKLKKRIPGK